jgi:hypothetical protein
MDNVPVVEAANNMDYGVDILDMAEELVAETCARGGAFDQSGDIDEFEEGGNDGLRRHVRRDAGQAVVRDRRHTVVRIDGAEGVVFGRHLSAAERVEKR